MNTKQMNESRRLHQTCCALLPAWPLNLKHGQPIRYRKEGRIRRGHIVCLQYRRPNEQPAYTVDDYKGRRVSVEAVSIVATEEA